jgi:RHH-type proline utilization regulon transcriptional repressor/proline dehydrogenase/delta 1-pyrroline-5-carboxylate dehydrogenase
VKGAYWDQETIKAAQKDWQQPVFNDKASTDANFETMTRLLLENHEHLYGAIGSHNVRSQAYAMAIAETLQIPPRRFELQVLYGMADKLAKAIVAKGYRVRVYCPYGELIPGMSYLIRRLLENTANSSFLRQNLEERPVEELLAAPTILNSDSAVSGQRSAVSNPKFINAPDADYADPKQRDRALQAIQTVRQQLGKTYQPLIDGEYVATEASINSLNPSNFSETVGQVGQISVEQADRAMESAKTAFLGWKRTPPTKRAAILHTAADLDDSATRRTGCLDGFRDG